LLLGMCGKRLEYEGGKEPKKAAQRAGAEVCHRDSQLLLMSFKENAPLYAAEVRLHILKHPANRASGSVRTPLFLPEHLGSWIVGHPGAIHKPASHDWLAIMGILVAFLQTFPGSPVSRNLACSAANPIACLTARFSEPHGSPRRKLASVEHRG
jgi:hypothetical protein